MQERHRPLLLIILDGWGYSEEVRHNAIRAARTPFFDRLWQDFPHTLIRGSGAEVGLPAGQMGNSEVGHLNLGAGRVVYQEFTRIGRAIKTGSFFTNQTLTEAVDAAKATGGAVHVVGLLSPGGVHSHEEHLHAMVELAVQRGAERVYLHAFLDGRDTPPRSAHDSVEATERRLAEIGRGRIGSLVGRYYAMDRDHRWPRVQAAYDMLTLGEAPFAAQSATEAVDMAYARGENDEFVQPTLIHPEGEAPAVIRDGDAVVFMNFRSDRARQITRAFIEGDEFDGFERRARPQLAAFVTLTEYNADFDVPVAYPPERLRNIFGEYVSRLGLHQLRIAETEKYAHVTFFFNGGVEEPFVGEERVLVPSPQVPTYDCQPEMSAPEVTRRLIEAVDSGRYDVIICNYANLDMVGHTGDFEATVRAVEALDGYLEQVVKAVRAQDGEVLITADHGNAEQMYDGEKGQAHTAHTCNPVPLIYVGRRPVTLAASGILADIAPTMLELLGLEQPVEMTGHSLIVRDGDDDAQT